MFEGTGWMSGAGGRSWERMDAVGRHNLGGIRKACGNQKGISRSITGDLEASAHKVGVFCCSLLFQRKAQLFRGALDTDLQEVRSLPSKVDQVAGADQTKLNGTQ